MICFVRHTRVGIDKTICYGQTDVEVADSFIEEAQLIKKRLDALSFDMVYSSPLTRCVKLASYCGYKNAIQSNAILELDFGDWENKKWDDLDMKVWENDWVTNPAPNGESFTEMYQRVSVFISKLPSQNILIFTHKGVMNCAKSYFRGISLKSTFDEPLDYGEILMFE